MRAKILQRKFRHKIKNEINVTPFVDVMLVLLIVFMVTAPIMHYGFDIELPESRGENINNIPNVNITIDKSSKLFLEQEEVHRTELIKKIRALIIERPDLQVMLHADKNINYGVVMNVFTALRHASIKNITFVTEE